MITYYIDEMYNLIDKPNPNTAGIFIDDPFEDCEYMVAVNPENRAQMKWQGFVNPCPGGSDYMQDCPLLIGNDPCQKARKCYLRSVELRYKAKKWKQKKLF